jgi:Phosphatidylserine/phosphatidylglycerophosphate/cardiolipin synthases and related enzymes
MFRNGYWQKIVLMLTILIQLLAIVAFILLFFVYGLGDDIGSLVVLIFLFALQVFVCVFIVQTDAAVDYKVVWLVFVGAFPVLGQSFYLLFAHKLRTKKESNLLHVYYHALKQDPSSEETKRKLAMASPDCANVANYVEKASNGGVYQNTSVEYFPLGDVAYPVMLRELKKAKHYIFIEYFIIKPGKMWDSILEILREKVKEGLDVRVVYDDVGNLGATPVHYWRELCAMGIQARSFARLKPILDVRLNNRDHRKIMGFPGECALRVRYFLKEDEPLLRISYQSKVSEQTPLNFTCHTYFNLGGEKNVDRHLLHVKSHQSETYDSSLIPQGFKASPSCLDFSEKKRVGKDIDDPYLLNSRTAGYDHCFLFSNNDGGVVLSLESEHFLFELKTSLPAVQIYSDNYPHPEMPLNNGQREERHSGLAIEPVYAPLDYHAMTALPFETKKDFIEYHFSKKGE